jgi:hypothetical protein
MKNIYCSILPVLGLAMFTVQRLHLWPRRHSIRQRSVIAFVLCAGTIAGSRLEAQRFVPLEVEPLTNQIRLSWPTIPGKTYDLFWSDEPQELRTSTNSRPLRAGTTIGTFTDSTADTNVSVRFYGVKDRATLPGNNGAITAASVIELEKVLGLTFSDRSQLPSLLSGDRSGYEARGSRSMIPRCIASSR